MLEEPSMMEALDPAVATYLIVEEWRSVTGKGLGKETVHNIARGRTWTHLERSSA